MRFEQIGNKVICHLISTFEPSAYKKKSKGESDEISYFRSEHFHTAFSRYNADYGIKIMFPSLKESPGRRHNFISWQGYP